MSNKSGDSSASGGGCRTLLRLRPVDWLEEADRQLYLTTPSTGNNNDSRQRRRIDFVLVYSLGVRDSAVNKQRRQAFQHKLESVGFIIEEQDIVGALESRHNDDNDDDTNDELTSTRLFSRRGRKAKQQPPQQQSVKRFVRLHAPFELLLELAEKTRMKLPIEENRTPSVPKMPFDYLMSWLPFTKIDCTMFPPEQHYFLAEYSKTLRYRFEPLFDTVRGNSRDLYFTPAQRSRLVYDCLLRTPFETTMESETEEQQVLQGTGDVKERRVLELEKIFTGSSTSSGIELLLRDQVYDDCYPLHAPLLKRIEPHMIPSWIMMKGEHRNTFDRMKLWWYWSRISNVFKDQPVSHIKDYFGEHVALYFCWLRWYIQMLLLPCVLGLSVFFYGLWAMKHDVPTNDICNKLSTTTMCPRSHRQLWQLGEDCLYAKMAFLFDNKATVAYAAIVTVWSALFLPAWDVAEYQYQYEWDTFDLMDGGGGGTDLDEPRPDFKRKVRTTRINPITGVTEQYMPTRERCAKIASSFSVVAMMIFLVLSFVFGVVLYRVTIKATISSTRTPELVRRYSPHVASITGAFINLVVIIALSSLYERLAIWLTDYEIHRTEKDYENALTLKMFLFQFVNFYASIFYIAFIKPWFANPPGAESYKIGKYKTEECEASGCLAELSIQLLVILVGKQVINNLFEVGMVKFWTYFRRVLVHRNAFKQMRYRRHHTLHWYSKRPQEEDFMLERWTTTTLFYEYLELIIQYGFVTMFLVAFPLAPLCAFLNNIVEIRIDAHKFVSDVRRPVAKKVADIGIWRLIIAAISKLAILTNGLLIALTSDFVPRLVYQYSRSQNRTLVNYVNFTLSAYEINRLSSTSLTKFNTTDIYCFYKDHRTPPWDSRPYQTNHDYYVIMVARLAFLILFEHVVFICLKMGEVLMPLLSKNVKQQIARKNFMVQTMHWGAHLYEKNPELIERDMQRIVDVNPQHRHSNGGYELIYDLKRTIRHQHLSNTKISQDEYRRPGSLKEMKADLTRALQTILSEDIIDLGIR
ncbi:unnamed protein product [Adineta steineri]|uniref:Anoctamin n=1 Tax=Adineta steineri TaxID=433720 RepID=A0A818ITN6_9BILA|nr:unnamed protein product [Adineta steineri]CAF3532702.1 unnamed protein product [Adineta steineri]